MDSYNYPATINFSISNIFGIQLDYSLSADNYDKWKPLNNSIVGSFTPIP
jgi:hypothetical protein